MKPLLEGRRKSVVFSNKSSKFDRFSFTLEIKIYNTFQQELNNWLKWLFFPMLLLQNVFVNFNEEQSMVRILLSIEFRNRF